MGPEIPARPVEAPARGPHGDTYSANDASVGDVDGDGSYEIVLKWDPSDAKDNSQSGMHRRRLSSTPTSSTARACGASISARTSAPARTTRSSSVYDFDGDGKAEIAVKTAPGTKAGNGKFLSLGRRPNDDDAKHVSHRFDGYVLTGPEYLTVFEGTTGAELATVDFDVPRGTVSAWGDDYGNRVDRFNGGVAFVSDMGNGKAASGRPASFKAVVTTHGSLFRL